MRGQKSVKEKFMALLMVISLATPVMAVESGGGKKEDSLISSIAWVKGPATVELGTYAKIKVPERYLFCPQKDAPKFLEATGNPPSDAILGILIAPSASFSVYFEFSDIGYVKDDEKDKLDPDKILKSIRDGTEEANKYRKEKGWPTMEIVGWQQKPFYDSDTHHLTWAVLGRSEGRESVNYNSRILGRKGVMEADLVTAPERLEENVPVYRSLLAGFDYNGGQKYSEYRAGDQIAKYGLAALVAGGAAVAAAKFGLFAKLWKFLIAFAKPLLVAFAAFFAAIWRFLRRLFTGSAATEDANTPK